ncbi:ATP-binding protein [Spirillospora sp. CA-128828]|uniref:sensor histidine kinase n=1 Tax=Spirillospora sp. CA-128828 TaxID=3240033 RepID=UPI003D94EF50
MTTHPSQALVRPGVDEPSGQARDHARELVDRLTARGLSASGKPHTGSPAGAMAVSAQRVDLHPYAGRLVVLLPGPHDPGELLWHWPRLYSGHEHTGACWFQPFSPAAAYDDTATMVAAAIEADVRRRHADGEAGVRQVLDRIGQPLHKLVYRQLMVLDELQRGVEDPALLRRLYGIDHLAMRALRGLERIAVLGGARARQLPEPLQLSTVLRQAASQVELFPRVRIPPPGIEVDLPRDAAPEITLLLAELIENATQLSPADVVVTVTPGDPPSAGLRIEIADRGLPMPPDQRATLNRVLADPDSVELREQIITGPIGLLVVARLAERHGVQVRLHPNPGGGTRAVVELPETLLLKPRLPFMSAPQPPTQVITGALEPVAELVRPSRTPSPHTEPAKPSDTIEPAEAPLPRRRGDPHSEARTTSAPETEPGPEPGDGSLPPLPRRPGAHRTVSGPDVTNSPATSSNSTATGADVGPVAAFLQGAHAPDATPPADRATDHAADQNGSDALPAPSPEPRPQASTN